MLVSGTSVREAAKWLKSQGVSSSPAAVGRHLKGHIDVKSEMRKRLFEESLTPPAGPDIDPALDPLPPALEAAVVQGVNAVRAIDRNCVRASKLLANLIRTVIVGGCEPTKPQADLIAACMHEVRASAVARHELVHGKNSNVNVAVTSGLDSLLNLALGEQQGAIGEGAGSGATPPSTLPN